MEEAMCGTDRSSAPTMRRNLRVVEGLGREVLPRVDTHPKIEASINGCILKWMHASIYFFMDAGNRP